MEEKSGEKLFELIKSPSYSPNTSPHYDGEPDPNEDEKSGENWFGLFKSPSFSPITSPLHDGDQADEPEPTGETSDHRVSYHPDAFTVGPANEAQVVLSCHSG